MKCLGASNGSPRDVTFGSTTSLGPISVSPVRCTWTRVWVVVGSFSLPALLAQRVRAVLSAGSFSESILLGRLSARGPAMAAFSGWPDVAGQRTRQGAPPGAVAAVSAADSAGRSSRIVVHGRIVATGATSGCNDNFNPTSGSRGAHGPAPSVKICEFFRSLVRAAGLLRGVRGGFGVVVPALLFVRLSPSVTQCARSGSPISTTATRRVSAITPAIATGPCAVAVMSLPIVW